VVGNWVESSQSVLHVCQRCGPPVSPGSPWVKVSPSPPSVAYRSLCSTVSCRWSCEPVQLPLGVAGEGPAAEAKHSPGGWPKPGCSLQPALSESVDGWPLAIDSSRHLGVSLGQYPSPRDVIGVRYPPLGGCMSQFVVAARQVRRFCGGPASGELSGGNWMALRVDPLWGLAQWAGRFVAPT
jgi:hypothetical protein